MFNHALDFMHFLNGDIPTLLRRKSLTFSGGLISGAGLPKASPACQDLKGRNTHPYMHVIRLIVIHE